MCAADILTFAEEGCRYFDACRGGVRVYDLWRRSYFGVCRGGVCVSDLWRCSYFGVCRGGVGVSEDCPKRVSSKSALQEYHVRLSYKSAKEVCRTKATLSSKNDLQNCALRVSCKSVK